MAGLPPLPPGASLMPSPRKRRDPLDVLREEGFTWTNGYRTPADTQRIREQGYKPADNSLHLDADAVDLTHPRLSPAQQTARLRELCGDWEGFNVLDEGHHRHMQLPGWGGAPGTPGTAASGLPPLPDGATLYQRGSLDATPPLDDAKAQRIATLDQGLASGDMTPEQHREFTAGVRAETDPAKVAQLEDAFNKGATPAQMRELEKRLGVSINPRNLAAAYEYRKKGGRERVDFRSGIVGVDPKDPQREIVPRDTGTGRLGAIPRAVANALTGNLAGEIQGLGATTRQWLDGDIPEGSSFNEQWGQNNRFFEGAYAFDRQEYPVTTYGTELAASIALPFGAGARGAMQLGKVGAGYGAVYGFGDAPGSVIDRLPNAAAGAGLGFAGGAAIGKGIDLATPYVARGVDAVRSRLRSSAAPINPRVIHEAGYESAPVIQDGFQGSPGARPGTAQGAILSSRDDAPEAPGIEGAAAGGRDRFLQDEQATAERAKVAWRDAMRANQASDPDFGPEDMKPFGDFLAEWRDFEAAARSGNRLAQEYVDGALPPEMRLFNKPLEPGTAAMAAGVDVPALTAPRQRDYLQLPPLPLGARLLDDSPFGRVREMNQQATPEEIAAMARNVRPDDVVPIPDNVVRSVEELESSIRALEPPRLGRTPRKPGSILGHVKEWVQAQTSAKGMPVRIDAEDAINNGVPAEYIYINPNVADKSKLRLRNPSIFGTKYGAMSGTQQHLRSLDALDLDPIAWGFDDMAEAGRLEPEDIGDLLRRGFEGDESALNRADPAYGPWSEYETRAAERAEFDGRFPDGAVERVGSPATLDDLRANEPPATAYEDLPKVGGRVANINLEKLETRGDIRRALQNVETRFGGFDAARRGRISQAETEALAAELKMTPDDLLKRRKGQALNAEQALAARQILAKSSDELVTLAGKVMGGSDEDVAAFQKALLRHAAIQEQVSGATAEAGRALAQFKMAARSKAVRGRVLEAAIQGGGGRGRLEDAAEAILDLQRRGHGPAELNETARLLVKPKWSDKLIELWYNQLLSGPQTHVVNVLSNMMTAALQLPEQATGAAIGLARRGAQTVRGKPDNFDRVLMSELGARSIGLMQGAREGLGAFARTLRTGEVPDFVTKVEARSQRAISGMKGEVIRVPSRLLAAEDEFFKATARRMELAGLAVRKARSEGLRGEAMRARIAELTARPTEEMIERSLDYARYLTFQRPVGKFAGRAMGWTQDYPWLKLFFPFIRTPTNIFKHVIERSPAAPLLKEVRDDFRAGGARRDLALARIMLGTGFAMLVTDLAARGHITGGGPSDRGAKDLMRADGWQPYSVRVGDKYYSYQRLDPLASTMGIAADLVDRSSYMTAAQQEKSAGLVLASILQNMSNKTWLSGAADLAAALDDPERGLGTLIGRLGGSIVVPTVVAQATRTIDPTLRETKQPSFETEGTPLDWGRQPLGHIQSRIPFASRALEPKRDVWGEEIKREGGVGPDFTSPIWVSTARNDPVNAEMLAIGARAGRPSRTLTQDGVKRKLSPAEYGRYQALSGRYMKEDIQAAMADPEWKLLARGERTRIINQIKREARAAAREELFAAGEAVPPLPPGAVLVP